jgi:hypothetical protein
MSKICTNEGKKKLKIKELVMLCKGKASYKGTVFLSET